MIFSASKNGFRWFLLAGLFMCFFPVFSASAQLEQPTSSISFPTSTVTEPGTEPGPLPDSEPVPGGPPPMFFSQLPYPYPEARFDPATTRLLYMVAAFLVVTGILLMSGTVGRLLSPLPASRRRRKGAT